MSLVPFRGPTSIANSYPDTIHLVLGGRTYDALPRNTVAPVPDEALRLLEEAEALAAPWLVPPALALGA